MVFCLLGLRCWFSAPGAFSLLNILKLDSESFVTDIFHDSILLVLYRNFNCIMKETILKLVNRYKIPLGILLFFLIYMLFFDEYNWIRIHRDSKKLEALKNEREYLIKKIEEDRKTLQTLQTDTDELEKFAREQYLLKKDNEEVFIIQEE